MGFIVSGRASQSNLFNWTYKNVTTSGDPSSGGFRQNNLDNSAVTALYISHTTRDGLDLSNFIGTLVATDTVLLQQRDASDTLAHYEISGARTNNTTWSSFPVTFVDELSASAFQNNKACVFVFQT